MRKRVCFLLRVRPERLEEYKKRHKAVWPEMLKALHDTGWHNYSLFLRKDGLLVGYLETEDFKAALEGMKTKPVNDRWQREMAPFFVSEKGEHADDQMQPLEEVFHLD
jgi:L-rhamnose mutarotase